MREKILAVSGNEIQRHQGFEVYVLRSQAIELAVVPELGARIISLKNLRTGRQWLWHPVGGLKLFRNGAAEDFSLSTLAGVDECLPTIAPCVWQGRKLPDHGEVWSVPWHVDQAAWAKGILRTSVGLKVSPFDFERTLEVLGNAVRMKYRLANRSDVPESFLWALHPLLNVQPGDRLILPTSTRALLDGDEWIDAVDSTIPEGGCAKVFAAPLLEGRAGVHNKLNGDRLLLEWDPVSNNTLGLWLTRGGWHGHHHLALEPTNGAPDPLALAAAQKHCGTLPARGSLSWTIFWRLEPQF